MEFLSLRPANFSLNRNVALHARSLGPPWPKLFGVMRVQPLRRANVSCKVLLFVLVVFHLCINTNCTSRFCVLYACFDLLMVNIAA